MSLSQRITRARPGVVYRRAVFTLLAAGLLSLLSACASGPDQRASLDARAQAKAAYLAGDYPGALVIVEPQATAGAAWAQYTLGYMYYYGYGLRIDRLLARQWIEQAAAQGYPPAKTALHRILSGQPAAAEEAGKVPPGEAEPPRGKIESPPEDTDRLGAGPAAAPAGAAPETPPVPKPAPVPEPQLLHQPDPILSPLTAPTPLQQSRLEERSRLWIAGQNPGRLTLQLIGSSDQAAIARFLSEEAPGHDAAYYATTREGQPWYVVVYGSYADRAEARAALQRLSTDLRRAQPWIRPFADIQQQVQAASR